MTILFAWLLADFLSGLIHWWEDRVLVGPSKFAFVNRIKADNDLHHSKPAALTRETYWGNINTSVPVAWPLALGLFLIGCPTVIWLAVFFASFANLVHRFSHMPKRKIPRVVRFLQWTRLFISVDHHAKHHFDENGVIEKQNTTIRYCPMTGILNPVLDRLRFFHLLELFLRLK